MIYPEIQAAADEIAKLGKPLKIFKLALFVKDDTANISELACFLYTAVDCDCPYDLVIYKESEWNTLSQDPRTFAWSIRENGSVLYG